MSSKQPRSDITRTVRPARPDELQFVDWSELSRYDLLLAAIPLSLLGAAVAGHLSTIPIWVALSVGALVAVPMLVEGLALNPPT